MIPGLFCLHGAMQRACAELFTAPKNLKKKFDGRGLSFSLKKMVIHRFL